MAYNEVGANQESIWYFVTWASNYICGRKELFIELDENYKENVTYGDSTKKPIERKGKILIKLKNGAQHIISNIYIFLIWKAIF